MSIKMESKQRTPSVIARLMGLDELSPHQPVQKKQRVLSENYLKRVASIGVREKRHSFMLMSAEEKKGFKDVFEELEKLKREKDYNLSVKEGKVRLTSSGGKKAFMSQKIVNANCGSPDLQLCMTRELHDLQGIPQDPHHLQSGYKEFLRSSHADLGKTGRYRKLRGTDQGSAKMLQKLETGLLTDSHGEPSRDNGYKFLRSRTESKTGALLPPTKIVVLKPNLGSSCNGDSHSIKQHKEFLYPGRGDLYVDEKEGKNVAKDTEPLRQRSRFLTYIPGKTGHGQKNLSLKASRSGHQDSETLAKECQLMSVTSPNSSYWRNQCRLSLYNLDRSYVAQKAKKDILERWRTTEKFQEVEVPGSCRTLGEMLSMPDHELIPKTLDSRLAEEGISNHIGLHSDWSIKPLEFSTYVQHRSREQHHNRKDGLKSRNSGSSCMKSGYGYSIQDNCLLQSELKRKLEEKDPSEEISVIFKSSSCSDICPHSENNCTIQESWVIQEEQNKLEQKDLPEQKCIVTESSALCLASDTMVTDMLATAKAEFVGRYMEQDFQSADCTLSVKDDFSSRLPDTSTQEDMLMGISKEDSVSSFCSGTDFESLTNSEEAYQPSPNSVLEPPFEIGISSGSEPFLGAKADLHGLQLQLELLKSESLEAYSEGTGMIVSSDDDSEEGSISNYGQNKEFIGIFSIKESSDFSYLVDVFTEAGFHGRNSNMGYETWHSPECPVNPAVFEILEKKYGEQMAWKRSERKLLFDRINSELMEILQPGIGMHWRKPVISRLCYRKSLETIEEELWTLLVRQEKQPNKDSSAKVLGKDDGWLDLGDDIEVVVREIENSLIEQLAAEVVSVESF